LRYARHKDENHEAIVAAFRAAGASVEAIESGKAGLPDLLVGCFGVDQLVEVKPDVGETRRRELRDTQVVFARNWRGRQPVVVRTVEQALGLVATLRGLMTRSEVA
jgi:hypothetical protein